MAGKIKALAATPARAEGEAVPLRIVIPATASIELSDSGLPVSAHAGNILQTLAAMHHVAGLGAGPGQWNMERVALTEGQRIIVPRNLVPMAAPSPASSGAPNTH